MSIRQSLSMVVLTVFASAVQAVQPAPVERKFFGVTDLQQSGVSPALIGARAAKSSDFPASFYSSSADGNCTSTMIASHVLLTAAHCIADGGTVRLSLAGVSFEGICNHAPGYVDNETADWALCMLSTPMTGVPFERVNTDAGRLTIGTELLLTGFGCIKAPGAGGNDGVYRIGEAAVFRLPSGQSNDIVTVGEVALCFGDSGGPAFLYTDASKRGRVVVSVNSRGNIKNTSYLSSMTTAPGVAFLSQWAEQKKVKLCGLHVDAPNCRPL